MPAHLIRVYEQRSCCNPVLPQVFDFSRQARPSEKTPWLNMRSGELREQEFEQSSQQRFPSSSHVVNKLKEA
jgi:hypothetical protein